MPRDSVRRQWRWGLNAGRWTVPCFDASHRSPVWAYVFRFASLFELRVEKHWLTHCAEIEPEVMERIAEIERWMEHHNGYRCHHRLKGISLRRWQQREKRQRCRADEARREMRAGLSIITDEAVEHIPSISPCGGTAGGMSSAASCQTLAVTNVSTFFAAVRLEILRPPKPDD